MHETFNRLIEHYGTLGILIVTTIEGEFGPLIGGAMARLGKLNLITLLLACWFGATLSTTTFFAIGRSQRDGRLVHKVTDKRAFALAIKWIDRHPRLFCFFYRFVYGLRIVGPVAISQSSVRWQTFAAINLFSSLLWAILGLSVGWFVGPGAAKMVGYYFTERPYLAASIVAGAVLIGVISWRARRSARRAAVDTQSPVSPNSPVSTAD
ncbi:MAG: DedA family protein [Sphingomonas sp.]|nr:DedA family protein [Sphingomonas sp.]